MRKVVAGGAKAEAVAKTVHESFHSESIVTVELLHELNVPSESLEHVSSSLVSWYCCEEVCRELPTGRESPSQMSARLGHKISGDNESYIFELEECPENAAEDLLGKAELVFDGEAECPSRERLVQVALDVKRFVETESGEQSVPSTVLEEPGDAGLETPESSDPTCECGAVLHSLFDFAEASGHVFKSVFSLVNDVWHVASFN